MQEKKSKKFGVVVVAVVGSMNVGEACGSGLLAFRVFKLRSSRGVV